MNKSRTWAFVLASILVFGILLSPGSSKVAADPIDHSKSASLVSLTRDSASSIAAGDTVSFTWTTQDVAPSSVTVEVTDQLGLARNVSWNANGASVFSGSATSTVTERWAPGAYVISSIVVRWPNGILRYKTDGSLDRFPTTLVVNAAALDLQSSGFTVAPVSGSTDPSVAASMTGFERTSPSTVSQGTVIGFQWSVETTPPNSVTVELLDPLGQTRLATWQKSSTSALWGFAQVASNESWPTGEYQVRYVFVRWDSGTLRYGANGSVLRHPAALSVLPPEIDLGAAGFTLEPGGNAVDLTVGASLVSVVRNSGNTLRDAGVASYSWSTQGSPANSVSIELTGPLGMTRYLNWASASPAYDGTITGVVGLADWPVGKYTVTKYTVRWPNGVLNYRPSGKIDRYPSTVQHVVPTNLRFVGFDVALEGTLTNTPQPTITGDALIGSTLTANPGLWLPAPVGFNYQWLRGDVPIPGAVWTTYKLTPSDGGLPISVAVTGFKTGYASVVQTSAATEPVSGGTLTAAFPTIAGDSYVGGTLTLTPGVWGPSPVNVTYQWNRDGVPIVGATSLTYVLTEEDGSRRVNATVSGSKPGYADRSRTSTNTGVILRWLTATPTPVVSGTPAVNSTLVGNGGSWAPSWVTLAYQWNRDGVPISGATLANYSVVAEDSGTLLTLAVTGSKPGYVTETRTSDPLAIP